MENIFSEIGEYIMTFGLLEKSIDMAIGYVCEKEFDSMKANQTMLKIMSKVKSTEIKIEILEGLINDYKMSKQNKLEWQKLIKDIKYLNKVRNKYAHNPGIIIGKNFIKLSNKFENGQYIEYAEPKAQIDKNLQLLVSRQKQLLYSVAHEEALKDFPLTKNYKKLSLE